MNYPGAVIFIGNDISDNVKTTILSQLFINTSITGEEFDGYLAIDGYYGDIFRGKFERLVVFRDLSDLTNREEADIVLSVKNGMVYVESNKYGPPGKTFQAAKIHLKQLFEY